MFTTFGKNRLDYVDNNTSAINVVEWKSSEKTKAAYIALFSDEELLTKIGYTVFKKYKNKELPTTHCAYILAICDILLNPKSPGIKCNDKSVVKRVNAFLVNIFIVFHILNIQHIILKCILFIKQYAYENRNPVTPEIMAQIAEEEAIAHRNRNDQSSQAGGSEATADDDDYDNLVS